MYSYGPFSHTGLKADLEVSEDFSVMAAVMNPTDMTEFSPLGSYTFGLQLGLFGNSYLNFLYGDQDGKLDDDQVTNNGPVASAGITFQADLTSGFNVSDAVYLGANVTYNNTAVGEAYNGSDVIDLDGDDAGFYGAAAYLQVQTSKTFALGTRLEYFEVFNNGLEVIMLDPNGDGNVVNVTLSGNVKVGNLTLIPELRIDATSEKSVFDNDMQPSDKITSFILAAVYSF